eukprot:1159352-Pelagomonas_calceolata.AAC.2
MKEGGQQKVGEEGLGMHCWALSYQLRRRGHFGHDQVLEAKTYAIHRGVTKGQLNPQKNCFAFTTSNV